MSFHSFLNRLTATTTIENTNSDMRAVNPGTSSSKSSIFSGSISFSSTNSWSGSSECAPVIANCKNPVVSDV